MSPPSALRDLLELTPLAEDAFSASCPPSGLAQVYGGQVVAQALAAATATVAADRPAHSLHASFLARGTPDVPLQLAVERLRDGRTFTARHVLVRQEGRVILSLEASFAQAQPGPLEHAATPPDVPDPESDELSRQDDGFTSTVMADEFPDWDVRRVQSLSGRVDGVPVQRVWLRHRPPLPDDARLQRCALAYLSDMTLLGCGIVGTALGPSPQVASLDHALWFQRPARVDDWLLYDQISPSATSGRSVNLGRLHDRSGRLVAVVAQEGLVRTTTG